jgi:hypothetical protein
VSLNSTLQADSWNAKLSYSIADDITVIDDDIIAALGLYGSATSGIGGAFTSVGFTYDPGDIYFSAETTSLEVDDTLIDSESSHATIGYRFGRFMPTLTFGMVESKDNDERDASSLTAASAGGLGLATSVAGLVAGGTNQIDAINGVAAGYATAAGVSSAVAIATVTASLAIPGGIESLQAQQNTDTSRIALGLRYDMSPGTALKFQYDIIETNDSPGLFDPVPYVDATTKPDKTNILTISLDTVF